ncbi:MAG: hypothetical protein ACP5GX_01845 [Anaerolineae bacterium]
MRASRKPLLAWSRGWFFVTLLLLSLACKLFDDMPDLGISREQRSPLPQDAGLSRSQPYPHDRLLETGIWEVRILDVVRGGEAWDLLAPANSNNEAPPEGWEYVMVKVWIQCTAGDDDEHFFGAWLTGDLGVEYVGFDAVPPGPQLERRLDTGEVSEGWEVYLLPENEGNLILVIRSLGESGDTPNPPYYLAVDPGAHILVDLALDEIAPTTAGTVLTRSLELGQMATTENWQIKVEQVIWDDEAWELLLDANQFNDPPAQDKRYLLVSVWARYIGVEEGPVRAYTYQFSLLGSDQILYNPPALVEPEPELNVSLYPGGEAVGWVALEVDRFAERPLLVFEPSYSDEETRYFALQP